MSEKLSLNSVSWCFLIDQVDINIWETFGGVLPFPLLFLLELLSKKFHASQSKEKKKEV